jgi:hypothetical protein
VRALLLLAALACGPKQPSAPPAPADVPARVAADFERAVLESREAYQALFDFTAVGKYEILLHRYDALGRVELSEERKAEYLAEDGTPYPPERERRNLGAFYPILAQRTVGTGGCRAGEPVAEYGKLLGREFEPMPPGNESHEGLRVEMNALIAKGGVVGIQCSGGKGGLALVWTRTDSPRGYDLITMYDDEGVPEE